MSNEAMRRVRVAVLPALALVTLIAAIWLGGAEASTSDAETLARARNPQPLPPFSATVRREEHRPDGEVAYGEIRVRYEAPDQWTAELVAHHVPGVYWRHEVSGDTVTSSRGAPWNTASVASLEDTQPAFPVPGALQGVTLATLEDRGFAVERVDGDRITLSKEYVLPGGASPQICAEPGAMCPNRQLPDRIAVNSVVYDATYMLPRSIIHAVDGQVLSAVTIQDFTLLEQ